MISSSRLPASTVKRSLAVLPVSPERLEQAIETLRSLEPVSDVRFDGNARLRIRYDASCVGFGDIERLLAETGIQRADGAWWRFKSAWYRFVDRNIRANALSGGGSCCNRPPPRG